MRVMRLCVALMLSLVVADAAGAQAWRSGTFRFVAGRAARIVVMKPDILVGSIDMGGVEVADPDWTAAAGGKLAAQIEAQQHRFGNEVVFLPDQSGEQGKLIADYTALFRTVASAAASHEIERGGALPAKRQGAGWTLGPGAARIGAIGGGDYALFVRSRDSFGTGGRKVFSLLTGKVPGVLQNGSGVHRGYAALVDLASGDLVWFNFDPRVGGDPRTDDGAAKRVRQLFTGFPQKWAP